MEKEVVTVGLDLAKNVFQIHAIGSDGTVLVRRKLRRAEVIMPGRHGSLCIGASLGARANCSGP